MDLSQKHIRTKISGKNLIVTISKKEEFMYCTLPITKFKTTNSVNIFHDFYITNEAFDYLNKKL